MRNDLAVGRAGGGWLFLTLRVAFALSFGVLCGCVAIPNSPERPERSSYGCMSAVVKQKVTPGRSDSETHCRAAGLIARYCSAAEAYLAGAGKEWRDMFTGGDVDWADWQADRRGIGCARKSADDAALAACCASLEAPGQ